MKDLEKSLEKLRQSVAVTERKIKSLEVLEEIAYWQMMRQFHGMIEEIERYKLTKAGFNPK